MTKNAEIDYIGNVAKAENVPIADFEEYLDRKPWSDASCGSYLIDVGQILDLLPPPPGRLLDVGVGSGWTSEMFARRGYEVVGIDISSGMIALANRRATETLTFRVCDYESDPIAGSFDIAVIYDSLHHADDAAACLKNVFDALKPGGVLVTAEPGVGHSKTPDSVSTRQKFGTNEKDMPGHLQRKMMLDIGFRRIRQFQRLRTVKRRDITGFGGALTLLKNGLASSCRALTGHTTLVFARKVDPRSPRAPVDETPGARGR